MKQWFRIITLCGVLIGIMLLPSTSFAQEQETDDNRTLRPGETVMGMINPVVDEDFYYIEGSTGMTIWIAMNGIGRLDSYLILIAPDGTWITTDDDGGGGFDAFINAWLPQNGTYTIVARSLGQASRGPYALYVNLTQDEGFVPLPGYPDDNRTMEMGGALQGVINPVNDEDFYYFEGSVGMQPVISMQSTDGLDSYLILINPDGTWVGVDDDSGGNLNARIIATLQQDGRYTIIARNSGGRSMGSYLLRLEPAVNGAPPPLPDDPDDRRLLSMGDTLTGVIEPANDEDFYSFQGASGMQVTITMVGSAGLDGYLILIAPDGTWIGVDDDSGGFPNPRIMATLPAAGSYTIVAKSYAGATVGQYALSLHMGGGM